MNLTRRSLLRGVLSLAALGPLAVRRMGVEEEPPCAICAGLGPGWVHRERWLHTYSLNDSGWEWTQWDPQEVGV